MTRSMMITSRYVRVPKSNLSQKLARSWLMILFATIAQPAEAQPPDAHMLFETRCGRWHDHAGDLARETLLIENGELVSKKSGRRLLDFLPSHFGNLNNDEIDVLSGTFKQQILTEGLYQEKCRDRHESARDLARQEFILRNSQLVGRCTGADIRRFLTYHGRLTDVEQTVVYDRLVWHFPAQERNAD